MKNKIYCFFLLLIFTTCVHAQTDTIYVHDTIVVYETIIVHDTIKVTPDYFLKDDTIQKSVLVFNTITQKTQLVVFKEKDTATFSINSNILSENPKNSESMKKEIIAIAAAAMLANASLAQENKTTKRAYSLETIVFQNKKDSNRTYSITLPTIADIRFNDRRALYNLGFNRRKQAQFRSGIITHIDDSLITVKCQPSNNFKMFHNEYQKELRKIRKDKTLSIVEKENRYFQLTYADSIKIPLSLIKTIRFSRFNNKNKRFYNSGFRQGFNEQLKSITSYNIYHGLSSSAGLILATTVTEATIAVAYLEFTAGIFGGYYLLKLATTKQINLKHWEIKNKN